MYLNNNPNHRVIEHKGTVQLYSYGKFIAAVDNQKLIKISPLWNYSKTNLRYFNLFLRECGLTKLALLTANQKEAVFEQLDLI